MTEPEHATTTSIRIRQQTKQQIDDLRHYGNNSIIIMIAIDRMWRDEQDRQIQKTTQALPTNHTQPVQ